MLLFSNLVHPCPHFLHLHILNKFCLLKLFVYCEFALRNLTYAFCANRLFTLIRMNFIASAHNTYLFIIFKRVYGISRFSTINIENSSYTSITGVFIYSNSVSISSDFSFCFAISKRASSNSLWFFYVTYTLILSIYLSTNPVCMILFFRKLYSFSLDSFFPCFSSVKCSSKFLIDIYDSSYISFCI